MPIVPVTSIPASVPAASPAATPAEGGFAESLGRLIDSADQSSKNANSAVADMLAGKGDVHDAMIALQRAELSLQLTIQVRNKVVQAYQEIMKMPV